MRLAVRAETAERERRVAAVPDTVRRLVDAGWLVDVERGAGRGAFVRDDDYRQAGARLVDRATDGDPDLLLGVQPPPLPTLAALRPGATVVSLLSPETNPDHVEACARGGLTALALELVPRIGRAQPMDVLTSQGLVVGYRGALAAAERAPVFLPGFRTAAGSMPPARVLVLGTGVVGLSAIATARRLGASVAAYDVRPGAAEEVASLGADFLPIDPSEAALERGAGGLARATDRAFLAEQRALLAPFVADSDVVLTTAAAPGVPPPLLITTATVERMHPGSVVVDLAADGGGNCELTRPGEQVEHAGVLVHGPRDVAGELPRHASELFARNVAELVLLMTSGGAFAPDWTDDVLAGCCLVRAGRRMETSAPAPASAGPPDNRAVPDAGVEEVARLLATSRTVLVVPGYGLAVARAHHLLRSLADLLGQRGVDVRYAVHPVAGRLPGHLDLLLDEAGVPAERIDDPEEANRRLPGVDVALIVGANDIVNPLAHDPSAPPALAGIPTLDVRSARAVVVLDRDARSGYAGVANPLFHDERTRVLSRDAAASLARILDVLNQP